MTDPQVTSIAFADLSLEQLVQLSQGIGHQIDKLRADRAYLKAKIDERLQAGERTSTSQAAGDAAAPGAVIDAATA